MSFCSSAPDAKFLDAFADAWHRFEIVRLQAWLQTVDLESGVATGVIWKPSKYLQRVAEERNGLHRRIVYQNRYKSRGVYVATGYAAEAARAMVRPSAVIRR
jgi:hypothetical protein